MKIQKKNKKNAANPGPENFPTNGKAFRKVHNTPEVSSNIKQPHPSRRFHKWFASVAANLSKAAGSPIVFFSALASIAIWAASGPYLGFSAAWQMIVNAGTTISTFLMVFIIQNSQNRDSMAVQIKLDEIIRALQSANNEIINLETLSHDELENVQTKFAKIGSSARHEV